MLSIQPNTELSTSARPKPTRPSPLRNEEKIKPPLHRNHKVHPSHKLPPPPISHNKKKHQNTPSSDLNHEDNLPINHLVRNGGNFTYDIEHLLASNITDGPYSSQPTLSKYLSSKSQTNWTQPFFNSAPSPNPPSSAPSPTLPVIEDKFVHDVPDVVAEEPTAELYKIQINQRQNAIHNRSPQFTRKFPRKFTLMELDIRFKLVQRYMKGERVTNYNFLNRLTNVKLVVNPITMEPIRLDPVYSKANPNPNQPLLTFMTLKKKQKNAIAPVPNSTDSPNVFPTQQKRGYRHKKSSNENTDNDSQSESAESDESDESKGKDAGDSPPTEEPKPLISNRPKLIKNHSRITPSALSSKPGTLDNPNPIKLSLPPLPHNPDATPKLDDKSGSLVPTSKPKKEKPIRANTMGLNAKSNNRNAKDNNTKRSATFDGASKSPPNQTNEADNILKDWFGSSSLFGAGSQSKSNDTIQPTSTHSTTSKKLNSTSNSSSRTLNNSTLSQTSRKEEDSYFSCPSSTLDFSDVSHLSHLFSYDSPSLSTGTTTSSSSPPSTPSSTESTFPFSSSSHDILSSNASSIVNDSYSYQERSHNQNQVDLTVCPSTQLNFDDPSSVSMFMSSLWDTSSAPNSTNSAPHPPSHTKQKSSGKIDSKIIFETLLNYSPTKPQPNYFHVNPHRNYFAIWQKTTPIVIGQLSKLGRNRQWQQREFRFDGLNLICLNPEVIPITAGDLVNMEDPDYINENWRSYFQPGQPPTPHLNHPLVATPLPKSSLVQHYQKPKWIIRIDEILDVSLLTRKGVRHPDCFVLNTTSRRYVLKCQHEKDLASWVYILQLMIRSYAKLAGGNLNGNSNKTLAKKFGEEEAEQAKFSTLKAPKEKSKFFTLQRNGGLGNGLPAPSPNGYKNSALDPLSGDCKVVVQDWLRGIEHLIDSEYDCKTEGWIDLMGQ